MKFKKDYFMYVLVIILIALFAISSYFDEKEHKEYLEKIERLESANTRLEDTLYNFHSIEYDNEDVYEEIQWLITNIEPIKYIDKMAYIRLYLVVIDRYSEYDPPLRIEDVYTDEEILYMERAIETETFDCPFEAKIGVASVILNRVEHDLFPTDPIEIVTSKNQFVYGRKNITESTKLALQYAFMIEDVTHGAIGFRSDKKLNEWNGWVLSDYYDGYHYFYETRE